MKQVKLPRCNILDGDGKRCRKHSAIEFNYQGEGEIYAFGVSWVRINLCVDHAVKLGYDFTKKRGGS